MASGLCCAVVLALFVIMSPCVSAGGDDCLAYSGTEAQKCHRKFCCGDCNSRYCCLDSSKRFDEDHQEEWYVFIFNLQSTKKPAFKATTQVSNTPQHPTAAPVPPESYQEMPHHLPQPGYPAQPILTPPYHGQPFTVGPPPSYQEAISPAYPPMPYGQAAFMPQQPAYPQPPYPQPKPSAPPATPDFLAQPAYNPDFASSPH
ncbi:adhesive plaque matrix protein [Neolamprologus brichardi]|uniref:adhesive plaque matrix protein n=1 Tax=Neolamprologus brichardi TaxID=32507 RepID=UPI001643EB4B|nr:adhesive plaque matrix protein [Neolamprologus brichardi]